MLQDNRILLPLYLCAALALLSVCATNNNIISERTLKMNETNQNKNASLWLTECRNSIPSKGTFLAHNDSNEIIELEWEKIDGISPRLNEKIRELNALLAEIYGLPKFLNSTLLAC